MPTIDFTGAYSDPTRAMTIKALQARREKLAQASDQVLQPQPVASVTQGLGGIANVIGANIREGRAATAAAEARDRMAQLMSGGLTPDEMGEAMGLDPETAMAYQQHSWETEKEAARQRFEQSQQTALFGHEDTSQERTIQAEKDRQAATIGHEDTAQQRTIDANKDAAAATVKANQEAAAKEAQKASDLSAQGARQTSEEKQRQERAALTTEQVTAVPPEIAAQRGGDIQKNPGNYEYHPATGDIVPVSPSGVGTLASNRKILYDQQDKYVQTQATVGQLLEAKNLLTQGINWGKFEGPVRTQAGASGLTGKDEADKAQRTIRYNSIMGGQALLSLAETLKGASSDKDVAVFMSIMNNDAMDPATKSAAIDDMMTKINANLQLQGARIQDMGGETPPSQVTATPPAEPTRSTGAGTGEHWQEGDVVTDGQGNELILQGGKWVPHGR